MNIKTQTATPDNLHLLDDTRLGMLVQGRPDGTGIGLPLWFDWTGSSVRMFAAESSRKVARARIDPRASLVVTNTIDEPSEWVAFDGSLVVVSGQGLALAIELADRYMDLDDPKQRETLEGWKQHPEAFCEMTLHPTRIRSGQ